MQPFLHNTVGLVVETFEVIRASPNSQLTICPQCLLLKRILRSSNDVRLVF
jgi:hypothetical protein